MRTIPIQGSQINADACKSGSPTLQLYRHYNNGFYFIWKTELKLEPNYCQITQKNFISISMTQEARMSDVLRSLEDKFHTQLFKVMGSYKGRAVAAILNAWKMRELISPVQTPSH